MTATAVLTDSPQASPSASPLKTRILFYYLDYGGSGGIEAYILHAARMLKERGQYDPAVVCCLNTPLYRKLREAGIRVHGLKPVPWLKGSILRRFDFWTIRQAGRIIRREKPALVHVHIGLDENRRFQQLGVPVAYTVHGYGSLYSLQGSRGPKRWWKHWVRRLFRENARHMDRLLFVSAAEEDRMRREGFLHPSCRTAVVPNGIAVDAIQHEIDLSEPDILRIRLGIPHGARCITYIHRLDANKNPRHFLSLARRLSQMPELGLLAFVMAGDGPLLESLRAETQDMDNLYLLGHREDVPALLALSELSVHTARHEGFGLGLLEAMAAGIPCISYASEGLSGILDFEAGRQCMVPVGDVDALTQKAMRLLTLPAAERLALGQALQKRAQAYDLDTWMERMEAVYSKTAPLVSVILPVHNGEATIERAVRSVLAQSYPRLQLLVVDDGSTDGTLTRLQDIRDPRMQVISQANHGVATARNRGFEAAAGEFIAFIDADDVWLPHKLHMELHTLNRQGNPAGMAVSGYYAMDEAWRLVHRPPAPQLSGDLSETVLDEEGIFLPSTTLMHRRVFETVGGFEPDCYHEDRAFFIRACRHFPVYSTGQHLVLYQQTENGRCRSILADESAALQAELSIIGSLEDQLAPEQLRRLEANQLRNLCLRFLMYGHLPAARRLYQAHAPRMAFIGVKGRLARLSLISGINWLWLARTAVQTANRLLSPLLVPGGKRPC